MNLGALNDEAQSHWKRADNDLQECRELLAQGQSRWAVVALFYSALHRVQTYLVQEATQPRSHVQRDQLVRQHLSQVADAYLRLKAVNEYARYEPTFTIGVAEVQAMLDSEYATIVIAVTTRLP